jgi:glycine/D-amino acid oxidase-like deaminating enzyme
MKYVIVGGGTAGWLSAAFIKKEQIDSEVVVIDSQKIPIIGAGEGSTGSFPWFLQIKGWEGIGKPFKNKRFIKIRY